MFVPDLSIIVYVYCMGIVFTRFIDISEGVGVSRAVGIVDRARKENGLGLYGV